MRECGTAGAQLKDVLHKGSLSWQPAGMAGQDHEALDACVVYEVSGCGMYGISFFLSVVLYIWRNSSSSC